MKEVVRVWIGDPNKKGEFNGTAFFIDGHTLITAKHVVKGNEDNIYITDTPDGGIIPIDEVILCARDIAILKVKKNFDISSISFSDNIKENLSVNIIGFYDNNSSRKSFENRIVGYFNKEHTYELQNHLTNGLSGSPVFLDGAICGVTQAISRDRNITYIIPISELCFEVDFGDNGVMQRSLEERQEEIEALIVSNELTKATTLIVKFVSDFSKSKNLKIEALLHQSTAKSLKSEIRKYGSNSDLERQIKQLKNSLFEFLEVLIDSSNRI